MPKRLELLHEVTPDAAKIAHLIESEDRNECPDRPGGCEDYPG